MATLRPYTERGRDVFYFLLSLLDLHYEYHAYSNTARKILGFESKWIPLKTEISSTQSPIIQSKAQKLNDQTYRRNNIKITKLMRYKRALKCLV